MQQIEERCVRSGNVEDDDARGLGGAAIVAHHLDIGRFDQSLARLDRYGRAALQYQREGALQHVDGYGKTMGVPDRLVTRLEGRGHDPYRLLLVARPALDHVL